MQPAAHGDAERRAARVAGALLFALAAFVAITSVASLLGYSEPKPTLLGIAILVAAAVVMPWLAKEKAAAVRSYRQCCVEGGRRTVGAVRLPLADRLGGTGDQRDLARKVGRPDCGFSGSAAHRLGGSGSHAREGLRLLLSVSPDFSSVVQKGSRQCSRKLLSSKRRHRRSGVVRRVKVLGQCWARNGMA